MAASRPADSVPTRWLGATAASGRDFRHTPSLIAACAAMCRTYPQLAMLVNFFDVPAVPDPSAIVRSYSGGVDRVEGSSIPGMKTLMWKRLLTPERTRHLEALWLFDADIAVHPAAFPLGGADKI